MRNISFTAKGWDDLIEWSKNVNLRHLRPVLKREEEGLNTKAPRHEETPGKALYCEAS
jgi:hypothetical protein